MLRGNATSSAESSGTNIGPVDVFASLLQKAQALHAELQRCESEIERYDGYENQMRMRSS